MCVVRIEALKALAAVIGAAIPELVGHICTGIAPSGEVQSYPSLTLLPGPMKYDPNQAIESATIGDPSAGVVVFNVGAHAGPLQLRLIATSVAQRWTLEQKLIDLFLSRPGAPGVIIVPVTDCPDLGDWIAAFELDSDQWIDTGAFDRKYESSIMANEVIPALVTRTGVYEMSDLVLGTDASATLDFDTPASDVEYILIHADGSVSPYVPPP